jgi:hypothetical protein
VKGEKVKSAVKRYDLTLSEMIQGEEYECTVNLSMPIGSIPLYVEVYKGIPHLYVLSDIDMKCSYRVFKILSTGEVFHIQDDFFFSTSISYVGSFKLQEKVSPYHVIEIVRVNEMTPMNDEEIV